MVPEHNAGIWLNQFGGGNNIHAGGLPHNYGGVFAMEPWLFLH